MGASGSAGSNGTNGTNGTNGAAGATGASGVAGKTGASGKDGKTGATGPQGEQGIAGQDFNGDAHEAGLSGVMAAANIGYPRSDEAMLGLGWGNYKGHNGLAVGGAKSWKTNKTIDEVVLKGSAFIDDESNSGFGASVNFHF